MSQNPRYAKNQVTGAGHLQEFKNTELVWKLRKTGFYEGSRYELSAYANVKASTEYMHSTREVTTTYHRV